MAYDPCNLSALTYANGFTLWHYKTADTTIPAGYFNKAASMLRAGDVMFINAAIHEPQMETAVCVVTSNKDGVVKVCDIANTLLGIAEA